MCYNSINNMRSFVIRKLAMETVIDLFRTPLWWYHDGLPRVFHYWGYLLRRGNTVLGVSLWVKNIFRPMFGQRDWQGKIISFFMRIVQIIARSFVLVLWFLLITAALLLWIAGPFLLIVGLIASLA